MKKQETLIVTRYVVVWNCCKVPLAERMFDNIKDAMELLLDQKRSYRPKIEVATLKISLETLTEKDYLQFLEQV